MSWNFQLFDIWYIFSQVYGQPYASCKIGGYIGLCLGYNLLQVPALITTVFKKLKVYFKSEKLIKTSNNISNSFDAKDNKENGHDEKQKKLNNDD